VHTTVASSLVRVFGIATMVMRCESH
jgi:hypothetical protein